MNMLNAAVVCKPVNFELLRRSKEISELFSKEKSSIVFPAAENFDFNFTVYSVLAVGEQGRQSL